MKDVEAAHHHHTPIEPVLVADVRFNEAREIVAFLATGSRYVLADRKAALDRELKKQVAIGRFIGHSVTPPGGAGV